MGNKYQDKIEFAEGYNKSFADFKKEFEGVWVFSRIKDKTEREKAMKEAHKAAIKGNQKKKDGNTSGTAKESKVTKSE